MPDFNPQLPRPVKWSVGENRYDTNGKQPRSISLFIPLESIDALISYVDVVAADPTRVKTGKVWDYTEQKEVEVPGVYINGKGRRSDSGDYGTINPTVIAPRPSDEPSDEEVPF